MNASEREIAERLRGERSLVIVSHENPDGDALGCVAALMLAAEQLGIPHRAFIPGKEGFPAEYAFLPCLSAIERGNLPPGNEDLSLYALDCANAERFDEGTVATYGRTVNIDHHVDNSCWGNLNLVDETAGSTTQVLYRVFEAGGIGISRDMAVALYVGLVTDTGRFQYSNTTPAVHRVAAELQELGVDVNAVFRKVYESIPEERMRLRTRAFERLGFHLDGRLALSVLRLSDFSEMQTSPGATEGVIDDLRTVGTPHVVALLREIEGSEGQKGLLIRGSLRSSDGRVDVARIAHRWGGGGHLRAAGFTSDEPLEAIIESLKDEIELQLAAG
jgi:phosphoesterase RecJ-like protein